MAFIGYNQHFNEVEPGAGKLTWLDYLIVSNPQGVMMVANRYGYTGYLAPQNEDEMYEVVQDLMEKHGDEVIIELLKSHPLYNVIADICTGEKIHSNPFRNAVSGFSGTGDQLKSINFKKLFGNLLAVIGAFYIADKVWVSLNK